MSARQLNQRVELQKHVKTTDKRGNRVGEWQRVIALWAKITHEKGEHETDESSQRERALITARVRINRRKGVKTGMRFVRGDNVYSVLYEIQNYQNAYSDFMCEQVLPV